MAHAYHHSRSSVRKWGGKVEDYYPLHAFLDSSKGVLADHRHRALLHHTFGVTILEKVFGPTITNSEGRVIPTQYIGLQHLQEDGGGRVWTAQDWLEEMALRPWMGRDSVRLSAMTDEEIPEQFRAPELVLP